ncbi:4Fe-4S dicluster domain-containing protein [Oxalobacteraceae bacterium A2-2]
MDNTRTTPRWGMALDLERCIGCHACSVACKVENSVSLGHFRTKVYYYDYPALNPYNHKPTTRRAFLPALCMQCADAPCLEACPNDAIERGPDGVLRILESECDRSRDCIKACPYGAIHIDPVAQIADKCDFCSHRLDAGMEPACVEACPGGVFAFGDLNVPDSPVSTFLARSRGQLSVLKPEEKTLPQVQYRGLGGVVPREMERKLPKGRNHEPESYEADTWTRLPAGKGR